jgi:phytoene dehydrogenase-like protein
MGQAHGQRGVWGYVRGGMGTITQGLAQFLTEHGGVLMTHAPVERIEVISGRARRVVLADGREFAAPIIVSNLDPQRTLLGLVGAPHLPADEVRELEAFRCRSGVVKINVATTGLPNFAALPGEAPGPQHRGTIHFCESIQQIDDAFDDARAGRPSAYPIVEMCIPSVVDETLAPPGRHFVSLFVQYAPYTRVDGLPWNADTKRAFADSAFRVIERYAPNWNSIVDDYLVLTPVDLEERFGMTGGNIFHGEMTLDQLAFLRPTPRMNRYRTPIDGLYLCGSGTHPGGGVLGAPGYLAAREILRNGR